MVKKSTELDYSADAGVDPKTELAEHIIQQNARLKSSQANFRLRWDDCARYIQPRKGNIVTKNTPGQPQTQNIYDTTAEEALLVYGAGVLSSLTPIGERWMLLQPKNKESPDNVKAWFDDATERLMELIGESNAYLGMHESFLDDGCFSTSVLFVDDSDTTEMAFNVVNVAVGTFTYQENSQGQVDTVLREWKWTARQIEQEFGRENLGPHVLHALRSEHDADADREFTLIHRCRPRAEGQYFRGGVAPPERRKWESVYVCVEDKGVIHEDGSYEMCFMACRALASNIEVYGRGPGIQAMPEIKSVNKMVQDMLVVAEKVAEPPWLMPDDSSYRPDNRPAGVTYWDATSVNNKPEQLQLKNSLDWGFKLIDMKQQKIKKAFFNDMFQMLTSLQEERREKTAYEVSQMVAERLVLFSPIFARLVKEKLNPMLHRMFAIALRKGLIKPPPPGFQQAGGYEIEYTSKIALAIKAIQNQALAAAVQIIMSLAPIDPSVNYLLKARVAGRDVLRNVGVRTSWIRSDDEIDAIMKAQQDKENQLQAAQAGLAASQAAKNLGPGAQSVATSALTKQAA